jgi:restriction system protein
MAIPDYETLMLPILRLLRDGKVHKMSDVVDAMADKFDLSSEERSRLVPSG